jgi:hypothetical protein
MNPAFPEEHFSTVHWHSRTKMCVARSQVNLKTEPISTKRKIINVAQFFGLKSFKARKLFGSVDIVVHGQKSGVQRQSRFEQFLLQFHGTIFT